MGADRERTSLPRLVLVATGTLAALSSTMACHVQTSTSVVVGSDQQFDSKQDAIAAFDDADRDAWALPDKVIAALHLAGKETVADIGAGAGYFSRHLARAVPAGKVYAVEVDAAFRRHIEDQREVWQTPNIETRLAMYENPLLPEASIDLVFISNTVAYFSDRDAYLAEVRRALVPGGRLAIIDFRPEADCTNVRGCTPAKERLALAQVEQSLTSLHLEKVAEETFLPYQYFVIWQRPAEQIAPIAPAPQ